MGKKNIAVIWLIIVLSFNFVVIVIELPSPAKAVIITVDDSGGADFTKIQDAINASNNGDTILVYNGTYYENIDIKKSINLNGENKNTTIINGSLIGDVIIIQTNWINITGFTISGSGSGNRGLFFNSVANCSIADCIIKENYYGIVLLQSSRNFIIGNNISNCWYSIYVGTLSTENKINYNNVSFNNFGIYLWQCSKNEIKGNNISNNKYGIYSDHSQGQVIRDNLILNNIQGLLIYDSYSNNILTNIMINDGIIIYGNLIEYWYWNNIEITNTVNGKPVYFFKNQSIGGIPPDAGQVILANCSYFTIVEQELTYGGAGIQVAFSNNISISGNNVSNNSASGIYICYSSDILIENCTAVNNHFGIYLSNSNNNNIINNYVSSNLDIGIYSVTFSNFNNISYNNIQKNINHGIYLSSSDSNIIYMNNITRNNIDGINLDFSNNNMIFRNNVTSNSLNGFYLRHSSINTIYNNNIIGNSNQAYDNRNNNYWDNGYPIGGNYWSDYLGIDNFKGPNQDKPGSDGIGDTNYSIDSDSVDNYPLMEPYIQKPLENYTILKHGWNLISLPLIQNEQSINKVLEMIDGYYDAVQWYNITDGNDPWKNYKVGKTFGNDLFELNESKGFWIYITQPGDTIFVYNGTQPTVNQNISLIPGWNLVGYPSTNAKNRTDALNNIDFGSDVDAIWTYNATTQTWKEITASDNFEVGRGYWMHSKVTKTWIVPL